MQDLDGVTVYSATDLVGFLACEHLTTLDRASLRGLINAQERVDEELDILRERGEEHEHRFLEYLRSQGRDVHDGRLPKDAVRHLPDRERLEAEAEHTRRLMGEGADVIYQATLFDGIWRGYADFLLRCDGPSNLGDHHYEVADTKLARKTKGGALLQMCVYSELVTRIQGRQPAEMHVALGGSGHHVDTHRVDDYMAYYRQVRDRFLDAVRPDRDLAFPLPLVPDPVNHCEVCRWQPTCAGLRKDADHLSLVASMRSDQARRLREAGIGTLTQLATLPTPLPEVDKLGAATMAALHQQARLQLASRDQEVPEFEFLPVEPNRGLTWLPAPSHGDLFFDMEGDPFAEEDGLEYLFGVWDPALPQADGQPTFHAWWGHSRADEKAAFEAFVDFVIDRWADDPNMHVYHYAAYERGRMGMLSTRHATREAEVDRMLRAELFVDLYKVVRQGMRIGLDSYSIKRLEPLYALNRAAPLKDAGSSVVAYEKYVKSVLAGAPDQQILDDIALYNQDDCRSNAELRDWLEKQRRVLAARRGEAELSRRTEEESRERPPNERDLRIEALARRLLDGVPLDAERRAADPELQGRWLLGNALEWHRREEKVEWWAFFDRCSRSDEELASRDEEAIGQLTWEREIGRPKQSVVHRYLFDPEQTYRLKVGDTPVDPATKKPAGEIVALDALNGTLDLKSSLAKERPHPRSLIPKGPYNTDAQKGALERLGAWVADNSLRGPGPWRAARDFLLGELPRAGQPSGQPLIPPHEEVEAAARRIVLELDETVLPVQGPPGSGKTYTGAEMILSLIRAGRKVGIVAFTHRALTNLLDEVLSHALQQGLFVSAIRKVDSGETLQETLGYDYTTDNGEVFHSLRNGTQVAAGTTWMWARPEFEGIVDTLFIDEAGQMSLANVLAVSGAARNLVLLGDPQQLSQVKKGAHPEGVDQSALEHVLAVSPVIKPEAGIFLPKTYRLHRDVNDFTSEVFYAGQLESAPEANGQSLTALGRLTGTGVRWIAVEHAGNRNASKQEAAVVRDLYADLLGGEWVDQHGQAAPLTPAQILVVAPYNAQVEMLTARLMEVAASATYPDDPRVGTVDKIQGQQAAAVIYSMATSSQHEMPRTMEFLYSLNRLNVATSRGRCLAVIVATPDLLRVTVHTPFQMKLANALCRFVEIATKQSARAAAQPVPVPAQT
ncbi:MAG TPA: TM0106 family RecB-like putative nuclease [Candidatus Limnocylindria bacterium]